MKEGTRLALSLLKKGTVIKITPEDKLPDTDRILKVYELTDEGILYGVTDRCDGYIMPYTWIKDFKIIK